MGTNSKVTLSRIAIYFMIGGAGGAFTDYSMIMILTMIYYIKTNKPETLDFRS